MRELARHVAGLLVIIFVWVPVQDRLYRSVLFSQARNRAAFATALDYEPIDNAGAVPVYVAASGWLNRTLAIASDDVDSCDALLRDAELGGSAAEVLSRQGFTVIRCNGRTAPIKVQRLDYGNII